MTCKFEDELISYLYGEFAEIDKRAFEQHLRTCNSCSAELVSFGSLRESIDSWKHEVLSSFDSSATVVAPVVVKKSALTALRQFFNLSPLWLKGAVAFASVVFCALAILAVARLKSIEKPTPSASAPEAMYTEQQLAKAVEKALAEHSQQQQSVATATVPAKVGSERVKSEPRRVKPSETVASRRPLTRAERQQLAADLRLTNNKDENGVDFLGERINY